MYLGENVNCGFHSASNRFYEYFYVNRDTLTEFQIKELDFIPRTTRISIEDKRMVFKDPSMPSYIRFQQILQWKLLHTTLDAHKQGYLHWKWRCKFGQRTPGDSPKLSRPAYEHPLSCVSWIIPWRGMNAVQMMEAILLMNYEWNSSEQNDHHRFHKVKWNDFLMAAYRSSH